MGNNQPSAVEKWREIPIDEQLKILSSTYCSECDLTTIVDYLIEENEFGIILKGKCKKCGKDVARLVEKGNK